MSTFFGSRYAKPCGVLVNAQEPVLWRGEKDTPSFIEMLTSGMQILLAINISFFFLLGTFYFPKKLSLIYKHLILSKNSTTIQPFAPLFA